MDAATQLQLRVSHSLQSPQSKTPQPDSLPDQSQLEASLSRLLKQARHRPVTATLALLQLANFFEIRTWVGKAEAADLLSDITRVLLGALPANVVPCRCDNYEFALLLHNECSVNAATITARVKSAIQSAASTTIPAQLQLHCAIGLASITPDIRQPDILFARARHDLCQLDDPQGSQHGDSVQLILKGLRRGGIKLNYQALVSLQPKAGPLFEVRCSLHTGTREIKGRRLFATAVPNALGEALDRICLHHCLRQLQSNGSLRLIVNLSLNSLVSTGFMQWLAQQVQQSGPLQQRLVIQISELDLLVAQHHMDNFGVGLQQLGLPLSITHFGCSKNALAYLPLLEVKSVKLHQSLTVRLKAESVAMQSLRQTVDALHEKSITVMASGVENLAMLPLLWQCGVDRMQGYCLQSPTESPLPCPVRHLEFRN